MPKEIRQVQFCLGVSKITFTKNLKPIENETVMVLGGEGIGEQQLLCSNIVELE